MDTLFTLRQTVGEIYAERATTYGLEVEAASVESAFRQVFKRYHAPVFPPNTPHLAQLEKAWWHQVVLETFQQVLADDDIPRFDEFFNDVFEHFASSEPWRLFPEVHPVLQLWSEAGVDLGIISNFDSRLMPLIEALEIGPYFHSITLSSQVGVAKPDVRIFQYALAQHQCAPNAAIHVGDRLKDDVQGALAAQIRGILIKRDSQVEHPDQVSSLREIVWPTD